MRLRLFAVPTFAIIALTLAAATFAAAGCGESSKAGTTAAGAVAASTTATTPVIATTTVKVATGKPLTRHSLIAKGDAICARMNAELAAISVRTHAEIVHVLPQVAIYNNAEARQLAKLVPPASLAQDWSTIINDAHVYGEYVSRIARGSQSGSSLDSHEVNAAEQLHRQMATLALHDGFKHCARNA